MKFCIQAYLTPTKRLKQIKKGLNFGRLPKHKFKVITDLDKSLDKDQDQDLDQDQDQDQDLDQDQDSDHDQNFTMTKNRINQKIILSELNTVTDLACFTYNCTQISVKIIQTRLIFFNDQLFFYFILYWVIRGYCLGLGGKIILKLL